MSTAEPPSPKLTTPFLSAGPIAAFDVPTEAYPESGKLICANPRFTVHSEAQLTKQELSAFMAVLPDFPAAGANCASEVEATKSVNMSVIFFNCLVAFHELRSFRRAPLV